MKKLIVNADDYGHTPGVSEGIRLAHLHGIVTSTSAMMNRPAAPLELENAVRLCPNLGIGVHLVLTAGKPLLPPEKMLTLIQADGSFCKLDDFVGKLTQINLDQVSAEWHTQVEKFIEVSGHAPDHLNSHHHSSYFTPALFERMLRLAEELNCPIRKPFGNDSADAADYLPSELAEKTVQGTLRLPGYAQLHTTDGFIGDFYDEGATVEHLIEIIERVKNDPENETFELMCHPAVVDDALMSASSYNIPRRHELDVLMNNQIKVLVFNNGIKLINFTEMTCDGTQ